MEKISDYTILEKIDETRKSIIYRGQKDDDDKVIIKVLKAAHPSPSEIARFKNEYSIIKKLDLEGVIKTYDIVDYNGGIALVLEDFDGISLEKFSKKEKIGIRPFLQIAIKLANILGNLHIGNIIHKDIKPNNILINAKEGKVKITDFGISTVITHEDEDLYNSNVIEGTLVYMSPEQTGRINRAIDYRTDLYSLGITFYDILTGGVPFKSKDPLEVIHSHIAREAIPPVKVQPAIPEVISDITMKLLSKTAEDRYQNGFGLLADLKNCLEQLKTKGKIEEFELARNDISIRFNIPQKLFGREKEIDALMSSFERVSGGTVEITLVSGHPGIGKTVLINEIHRPIMAKRGYFISGNYEQFRRDVPYSAIIQAFQGLVRQILTESRERIDTWKEDLLEALGPNGRVITDVIPAVELIIGKQPELSALGPEEMQNRFKLVFVNFTGVFAKQEHPLTFFLDDMQWADSASLSLIKTIITEPEIEFLYLIGSYRDNEVSATHPLMITLDEIEESGIAIDNITLSPLDITGVNQLISNFLRCEEEDSIPFAELVHGKTNGNPFFVNQFLKALYDKEMLKIDPLSGWVWDIDNIRDMQVTDNVVDLMAGKIAGLPENTREVLKICACIGNRFDPELLSAIYNSSIEETLSDLTEVVEDGLISIQGDIYRFHHDRIRETAYSLIPDDEKSKLHLQIGRLVLENTDEDDLDLKIFYIVDHLNQGADLLSSPDEKINLAKLNLKAGGKAKISTAYAQAVKYLSAGVSLLSESDWEDQYDLTYSLYLKLSECEYLSGSFDEAERLFDLLLNNSKTKLEKADIYNLIIILYTIKGNHEEAVKCGLECLKLFGLSLPANPNPLSILLEVLRGKLKIGRKKVEDLINLPDLNDPYKMAVMKLLMNLAVSAYLSLKQELCALAVIKMVNLSLKYGNTGISFYGYASLGMCLEAGFGNIKSGNEYGKLSLRILDKFNNISLKAKIDLLFGAFINHWTAHVKTCTDYLLKAYNSCLECGDLVYAGYALTQIVLQMIVKGDHLDDVLKRVQEYLDFVRRTKAQESIDYFIAVEQMVLNLRGLTRDKTSFSNDDFDEDEYLEQLEKTGAQVPLNWYYINKMKVLYIFENYAYAVKMALKSDAILYFSSSSIQMPEHYFYYSLTLTALYPEASSKEKRRFRKILKKNQKKMKKWSNHCSDNFLHKYLLVAAEMAAISGNDKEAMKLYEQAIKSAHENEYIQNEAIANELAAKFHLKNEMITIARSCMREAHYYYLRWGATAKVKDIEEKYPDLVSTASLRREVDTLTDTTTIDSTGSTSEVLDLSTVMKASQAISGEIILGKLLSTMMKIVIENAGAQKGFIILVEKKKILIEAVGKIDSEEITVLQSIPVDTSTELSPAIVNYVERTKENLILNDAVNEGMFTSDRYIKENRPKSILCAPIINQGRLTGILYLENNLTTSAFTPDRIEVLGVLSSQIAISIDNARLYTNLEDKVRERTVELQEARDEIWGEMQLAKKIQTVLLPHDPVIPGYKITGHMTPADEVGGDYYDVINGEDVDWVIIGDVSGHGVTAGLVMMMVQTSIQTIIRDNPQIKPSVLLEIVDRAICYNVKQLEEDKYMTITALAFYRDGRIIYSGLHQDLLLYRSSTKSVETIETNGMWLGIEEDLGRLNEDFEFSLNPDDILLLYTDGITEAVDNDRNMFGDEKLERILENSGKDSPDDIKNEIINALDNYRFSDDVTMVILKRLP